MSLARSALTASTSRAATALALNWGAAAGCGRGRVGARQGLGWGEGKGGAARQFSERRSGGVVARVEAERKEGRRRRLGIKRHEMPPSLAQPFVRPGSSPHGDGWGLRRRRVCAVCVLGPQSASQRAHKRLLRWHRATRIVQTASCVLRQSRHSRPESQRRLPTAAILRAADAREGVQCARRARKQLHTQNRAPARPAARGRAPPQRRPRCHLPTCWRRDTPPAPGRAAGAGAGPWTGPGTCDPQPSFFELVCANAAEWDAMKSRCDA